MKRIIHIIVILVLLVALANVSRVWMAQPYASIEYLETSTVRGKKNPVIYALSKLIPPRRHLVGSDAYRLYIYIHHPPGIARVQLSKDGEILPLDVTAGSTEFEGDIPGDTRIGSHNYLLVVEGVDGPKASAQAIINVRPLPMVGF